MFRAKKLVISYLQIFLTGQFLKRVAMLPRKTDATDFRAKKIKSGFGYKDETGPKHYGIRSYEGTSQPEIFYLANFFAIGTVSVVEAVLESPK